MNTRRVKRRTRKQKVRRLGGSSANNRSVYNRLRIPNNANLKVLFTDAIGDVQGKLRGDGDIDCGNIYIFLKKLLDIVQSSDFKTRIRQGARTIDALKEDTKDYCFGIEIANFMYAEDKLELLKTNPSEYFYQLSNLLQKSHTLKSKNVEDAYYATIVKVLGDLAKPVAKPTRIGSPGGRSNTHKHYRPSPYGGGKHKYENA